MHPRAPLFSQTPRHKKSARPRRSHIKNATTFFICALLLHALFLCPSLTRFHAKNPPTVALFLFAKRKSQRKNIWFAHYIPQPVYRLQLMCKLVACRQPSHKNPPPSNSTPTILPRQFCPPLNHSWGGEIKRRKASKTKAGISQLLFHIFSS